MGVLEEILEQTKLAVARLQELLAGLTKEESMSVSLEAIRNDVATLRSDQASIAAAITALADRLTNNPSEAEIAAVAGSLHDTAAGFSSFAATIDSLDPDVPSGSVTPEEPPAEPAPQEPPVTESPAEPEAESPPAEAPAEQPPEPEGGGV